jgi:hypothetical protein
VLAKDKTVAGITQLVSVFKTLFLAFYFALENGILKIPLYSYAFGLVFL